MRKPGCPSRLPLNNTALYVKIIKLPEETTFRHIGRKGIGKEETMAVRIITDSTSDIGLKNAKELGVDILPLTVHFGEEEYIDGVNLSNEMFYQKLLSGETLPTTSQITVTTFETAFNEIIKDGDEAVVILLASKLSGTFQSAMIARNLVSQTHIQVIDSESVTFGLGIQVREAVRLREKGMSAVEIAKEIERTKKDVWLLAYIGDLTYLQKGGRLSAGAAFFGSLLGIKPVIEVTDGEVRLIHKERGLKKAFSWIIDTIKSTGVDLTKPYIFGHSNDPALAQDFIDQLTAEVPLPETMLSDIGITVGTHIGAGCTGFAFYKR